MRIIKEDGDLWFNKAYKSGRIAAAIKENNNSVLYMYIGRGVYAAARIVGLACNNSLGPLESSLVIPMDGEDHEKAMVTCDAF